MGATSPTRPSSTRRTLTSTPRRDGAAPPVRVTRRIDYKQDNRGYLHDLRYQVFIVDVASGERRRLTGDEPDPADYNFPQWSPDGKHIAASRPNHNGMQSQLALIDVTTGGITLVGPEEGTCRRLLLVARWRADHLLRRHADRPTRPISSSTPSPIGGDEAPHRRPAGRCRWPGSRRSSGRRSRSGSTSARSSSTRSAPGRAALQSSTARPAASSR